MELQELFHQNPWWKDKSLIEKDYDIVKWGERKYKWIPKLVDSVELHPFSLHFVLGPRQAGKTTALKLLIQKLLSQGHEPKSLFYFNCENVGGFKELSEVLALYREFKEGNALKNSILFFDEITLPKEWYRAVKFEIDIGKLRNDVVILTGSSSIAVKREVELFPGRRGQGKDYTLLPLSFREFVKIIDPNLEKNIPAFTSFADLEQKVPSALLYESELQKHLSDYMEYGGYPLSVSNLHGSKEEAKRVYSTWIKNAFLKAERSDIIAKQIVKVLVETMQTDISWEKASQEIELKSPKTVFAYVDLLRSIFALNILYNLDPNKKKISFGRNKKIYVRDPLLLDIFEEWGFVRVKDRAACMAETLVVEQLVRMFPEKTFFWKNGFEVDAMVLEKNKLYGFEVKWSEQPQAKRLSQLEKFFIISKKGYHKEPCTIPLAVFLGMCGKQQ